MPAAEIVIDVLEDGTLSIKTGKIPDEFHAAADELMAEVKALLGGPVHTVSTAAKPRHTHHHDHVHQHEHEHE